MILEGVHKESNQTPSSHRAGTARSTNCCQAVGNIDIDISSNVNNFLEGIFISKIHINQVSKAIVSLLNLA